MTRYWTEVWEYMNNDYLWMAYSGEKWAGAQTLAEGRARTFAAACVAAAAAVSQAERMEKV